MVIGGIWIASNGLATTQTPPTTVEPAVQAAAAEPMAAKAEAAETTTAKSAAAPSNDESNQPNADQEPMVADSDEDVSVTTVTIRIHPDGSRVLEDSEVIGGSKLVVQLKPGQKRLFEIQHEGYSARRLEVDGSQPEIRVGLVPNDLAATESKPSSDTAKKTPAQRNTTETDAVPGAEDEASDE